MSKSITIKLPSLTPRVKYIAVVILAVSVLITGVFYWKDIYVYARYRDPDVRRAQRVVMAVAPKVVLPVGETPTVATITDVSKVNRGGVLRFAKNDDTILLYYNDGTAILYRPSVQKVVAIGPIIVDPSAEQVKGTRIVVRNGSGSDDTAQKKLTQVIQSLRAKYKSATITADNTAARSDYPKTIIIDLTSDGSKAEFTGAINETIDGQKGILPIGEAKPAADILIIIGKDT